MLVQVKNHQNRANCWWNPAAAASSTHRNTLDVFCLAGRPSNMTPDVTSWEQDTKWGVSRTFETLGTLS